MSKAKRPRWRWATRCPLPAGCRRLWRRKPHLVSKGLAICTGNHGYAGHFDDGSFSGYYSEGRTQEYFRRRFGRDLCPGKIRRLP